MPIVDLCTEGFIHSTLHCSDFLLEIHCSSELATFTFVIILHKNASLSRQFGKLSKK